MLKSTIVCCIHWRSSLMKHLGLQSSGKFRCHWRRTTINCYCRKPVTKIGLIFFLIKPHIYFICRKSFKKCSNCCAGPKELALPNVTKFRCCFYNLTTVSRHSVEPYFTVIPQKILPWRNAIKTEFLDPGPCWNSERLAASDLKSSKCSQTETSVTDSQTFVNIEFCSSALQIMFFNYGLGMKPAIQTHTSF